MSYIPTSKESSREKSKPKPKEKRCRIERKRKKRLKSKKADRKVILWELSTKENVSGIVPVDEGICALRWS